jgi:hypothetical protein
LNENRKFQKSENAEYFVIWCWVFLGQKNLESAGSLGWAQWGSKMKKGHVTHQSIAICTQMKKICSFRGQNGKNRLPEPKDGIWGPKSLWSCDISIVREFNMEQEKRYFWGLKKRIKPQSPKMKFGAQNQYGRTWVLLFFRLPRQIPSGSPHTNFWLLYTFKELNIVFLGKFLFWLVDMMFR